MGLLRMQPSAAALVLLFACIAPGTVLIVVFWKLRFGVATLPPTTAWIDEFSVERYRPMLLLRSVTDRSVTPTHVAHFRRERCRIFRGYLRLLAIDFSRVAAALKLVM